MDEKCECARGPVAFYVSVSKANGELLDRAGFCAECVKESAVKRAFDALGVHP